MVDNKGLNELLKQRNLDKPSEFVFKTDSIDIINNVMADMFFTESLLSKIKLSIAIKESFKY